MVEASIGSVASIAFMLLLLSGCASKSPEISMREVVQVGALRLASPAFPHNGPLPDKYGCRGAGVNPPLAIENIPNGTKSLALIVDDPDAPSGVWVHWVLWNISAVSSISEDSVPAGALCGTNDGQTLDYDPPCPPWGTHRYFFKLYALDTKLNLGEGARKADVEKAMQGHMLAQTELVGTYTKK